MSNNRNFHASNEEPRSGKFDGTGFKHMEKDLLPLYNKECSIEYVWQMFSSCCIAEDESAIKRLYH